MWVVSRLPFLRVFMFTYVYKMLYKSKAWNSIM
jgi:hypothetical protein